MSVWQWCKKATTFDAIPTFHDVCRCPMKTLIEIYIQLEQTPFCIYRTLSFFTLPGNLSYRERVVRVIVGVLLLFLLHFWFFVDFFSSHYYFSSIFQFKNIKYLSTLSSSKRYTNTNRVSFTHLKLCCAPSRCFPIVFFSPSKIAGAFLFACCAQSPAHFTSFFFYLFSRFFLSIFSFSPVVRYSFMHVNDDECCLSSYCERDK